jgi:hypothetical protein
MKQAGDRGGQTSLVVFLALPVNQRLQAFTQLVLADPGRVQDEAIGISMKV